MGIKGYVFSMRMLSHIFIPPFPKGRIGGITALCLLLTMFAGCASMQTTPLTKAAGEGDIQTVRTLLESGVDVNEISYTIGNKLTALHWAAYKGRTDIVRILLDAGAEMNVKDAVGYTPLHYAAYHGYTGVVRILLDAGADPAVVSRFGTPLKSAQEEGYTTIVRMLMKAEEERYLTAKKPPPSAPKIPQVAKAPATVATKKEPQPEVYEKPKS